MKEFWKDIDGFEGKYSVSNFGNVKSMRKNVVLKPRKHTGGYATYILYGEDAKQINKYGHLLVADAFLNKPSYKVEVNHKDRCKTNNHVSNLEYISASQNIRHMMKSGNYNKRVVVQRDMLGKYINSFKSTYEAARKTGMTQSSVSACCRGVYKQYNGFKWGYE